MHFLYDLLTVQISNLRWCELFVMVPGPIAVEFVDYFIFKTEDFVH